MPYLAHFGLQDHPFSLTPNVDYYYPTQENTNIIASLEFALRRESGIVKIVGEVGTGKTLLCRLLINKLVETEAVAYINAPQADAKSIILSVCEEFGVSPSGDVSPYAALNRFLVGEHGKGRLAVVVIDEAQHLGKSGLEAIRLVSNLETERSKLLQVVMFGQTELDDLLRDPALRQLNQRVVFSFSTKPLTEAESKRYVSHRLRVSRRQGVDYEIFGDDALTTIARRSGGIPRVINILADKSMLVAFSEGSPIVRRAHVQEAIKDTPGLVTKAALDWSWLTAFLGLFGRRAVAGALLVVLAVGCGGWFAWSAARRGAVEAAPAVTQAVSPPMASTAPAQPQPVAQTAVAQTAVAQTAVTSAPAATAAAVPAPAIPVVAVVPAASPSAPRAEPAAMASATVKPVRQGKPKRGGPSSRKTAAAVPASPAAAEPPPAAAAPVVPVSAPAPMPAPDSASQTSDAGTPSPRVAASAASASTAASSATAPALGDIPVTNDAAINATLPGRPGIYGSGRSH